MSACNRGDFAADATGFVFFVDVRVQTSDIRLLTSELAKLVPPGKLD
jgi:hypothetical protein